MKLNTSYIAAVLVLLGAIWFAFNNAGEEPAKAVSTPATAKEDAQQALPTVQVRRIVASEHPNVMELYGQSRSNREVSVSANTIGVVSEIFVTEGGRVSRGKSPAANIPTPAKRKSTGARANMRSMEADLKAARTLAEKGFQSSGRVIAMEAQMDAAKAAMQEAEIELENVNMRAAFSGIWERQDAQIGDFLVARRVLRPAGGSVSAEGRCAAD